MKIRGDTSTVGEGADKDHVLLAAFLEATNRIDRRAVHRSVELPEVPSDVNLDAVGLEPVNLESDPSLEPSPVSLEAHPTSLETHLASADPHVRVAAAPFVFRRANLVRA